VWVFGMCAVAGCMYACVCVFVCATCASTCLRVWWLERQPWSVDQRRMTTSSLAAAEAARCCRVYAGDGRRRGWEVLSYAGDTPIHIANGTVPPRRYQQVEYLGSPSHSGRWSIWAAPVEEAAEARARSKLVCAWQQQEAYGRCRAAGGPALLCDVGSAGLAAAAAWQAALLYGTVLPPMGEAPRGTWSGGLCGHLLQGR
jgi:hypothetical protein